MAINMTPKADESKPLFIHRFQNSEEGIQMGRVQAAKAAAAVWDYYSRQRTERATQTEGSQRQSQVQKWQRKAESLRGHLKTLKSVADSIDGDGFWPEADAVTNAINVITKRLREVESRYAESSGI